MARARSTFPMALNFVLNHICGPNLLTPVLVTTQTTCVMSLEIVDEFLIGSLEPLKLVSFGCRHGCHSMAPIEGTLLKWSLAFSSPFFHEMFLVFTNYFDLWYHHLLV